MDLKTKRAKTYRIVFCVLLIIPNLVLAKENHRRILPEHISGPFNRYREELVKIRDGKNLELASSVSVHQIMGTASIDHHEKKAKKETYFLYNAEHLKLKNYYFDIPVVYNEHVRKWMNYFLNKGKDFFIRYTERAGRYASILGKILEDYGLPRDLIFLAMAESGFYNNAKSWARAVGPWQFMDFTGRKFGLEINWYIDERRDPIKATIAAARYLKELYNRFGSWELAAASYNAGEGRVGKAINRYNTENFWALQEGRYLKSETKNYVPKIMALAILGKNLESFGFKDIEFFEPLDFDEIDVGPNVDLYLVSEAVGVEFEEIQRLNPEILRWQTPPMVSSYNLRLPVGSKKKWNECCKNKQFIVSNYQKYVVSSPVTLNWLAKKYHLKSNVLEDLNKVVASKKLVSGTEVLLPFRENHDVKDPMYADLYELPPKKFRRKKKYLSWLKRAQKEGRKIENPKKYYVVKRGDTLWKVAKVTGASLATIIRSNHDLLQKRMIQEGDRLAIK